MVLYLAHQEETEGSVWIKPDLRRVPVGGKVPFGVGVRGKTGVDLPDAVYEVRAISPDGKPIPNVTVSRDRDSDGGSFWKTEQPGEYQLLVKATAKDVDGTPVSDEAKARFLVYQDDTELLRPAADHQFLARLATAGGGRAYIADELPKFLHELPSEPLAQAARRPTTGQTGDPINSACFRQSCSAHSSHFCAWSGACVAGGVWCSSTH